MADEQEELGPEPEPWRIGEETLKEFQDRVEEYYWGKYKRETGILPEGDPVRQRARVNYRVKRDYALGDEWLCPDGVDPDKWRSEAYNYHSWRLGMMEPVGLEPEPRHTGESLKEFEERTSGYYHRKFLDPLGPHTWSDDGVEAERARTNYRVKATYALGDQWLCPEGADPVAWLKWIQEVVQHEERTEKARLPDRQAVARVVDAVAGEAGRSAMRNEDFRDRNLQAERFEDCWLVTYDQQALARSHSGSIGGGGPGMIGALFWVAGDDGRVFEATSSAWSPRSGVVFYREHCVGGRVPDPADEAAVLRLVVEDPADEGGYVQWFRERRAGTPPGPPPVASLSGGQS